jgi:hypothetical protein
MLVRWEGVALSERWDTFYWNAGSKCACACAIQLTWKIARKKRTANPTIIIIDHNNSAYTHNVVIALLLYSNICSCFFLF